MIVESKKENLWLLSDYDNPMGQPYECDVGAENDPMYVVEKYVFETYTLGHLLAESDDGMIVRLLVWNAKHPENSHDVQVRLKASVEIQSISRTVTEEDE